MSEKHVYLVRHGETTYNQQGLVQDGSPLLTEKGEQQANRVAERVQHLDFKHLVVSDFERTKQTAEPIAKLTGVEPTYSELFREVRRPSAYVHTSKHSAEYVAYLNELLEQSANPDWRHSDEENYSDLVARARTALKFLTDLEGDALVVSHGRFLRAIGALVMTGEALDLHLWQHMYDSLLISNSGIVTIKHDGERWQLLTWNDHAHFAE